MKVSNKVVLPDVFQMRVDHSPGFTHVVKRLESRGFKVKWARGWNEVRDIEWSICDEEEAEAFVSSGGWIVVDQPEAKQEDALPDEFTLKTECFGSKFQCTRTKGGFNFVNERGTTTLDSPISEEFILDAIQDGAWVIVDKKLLTAEQQRANAEAREQISALEHNIKLRKQDIEHAQILIANYEGRVRELEGKIVEEV